MVRASLCLKSAPACATSGEVCPGGAPGSCDDWNCTVWAARLRSGLSLSVVSLCLVRTDLFQRTVDMGANKKVGLPPARPRCTPRDGCPRGTIRFRPALPEERHPGGGGMAIWSGAQVKTHESINNRLALVMKSGKYTLGYKTTLKSLRGGKCTPYADAHERAPRRDCAFVRAR